MGVTRDGTPYELELACVGSSCSKIEGPVSYCVVRLQRTDWPLYQVIIGKLIYHKPSGVISDNYMRESIAFRPLLSH